MFSGAQNNINTTVQATQFQDGTHVGSGTPGTDQCGANHAPNVKILTSTTMSLNGASSAALNDTNLADTACTFRLKFDDAAGYALQNGRLYTYDGTTTTAEAIGVDAAVYVKGEGMTTWFTLNSDTATGNSMAGMTFTTADIGGNNASEYRSLANRSAQTTHFYYVALSVSPETAGGKSAFALGAYLEYY